MGRTEAVSSIRTEGTRSDQEEVAPDAAQLESTPELQPLGALALIEATHCLGMKRYGLVWHHHATTQNARHVQKEVGTIRMDLIEGTTNVPGHTVNIVIE